MDATLKFLGRNFRDRRINLVMGTNERRQIVEEIKKLDASKKLVQLTI
ncbi:hypothetical protein Q5M85_00250 [Paraclostridium bifermentans]|nr:hypothetical protein [Paraclostridium bifermentans]